LPRGADSQRTKAKREARRRASEAKPECTQWVRIAILGILTAIATAFNWDIVHGGKI
jgi:hypothetical protein